MFHHYSSLIEVAVMDYTIPLAIASTAIQLLGAYLRYLPFERELPPRDRHRLWTYLAICSLLAVVAHGFYFYHRGVTADSYRRVGLCGSLSFFLVSLLVLPRSFPRHAFVFGMQILWFLLVHTVAGFCILLFLPTFSSGLERVLSQTTLYITVFLLLLPLARSLFRQLLPPAYLFEERPLGWYLALLPLGLAVSPILRIMNQTFMYTWSDSIERLFLLAWIFIIYRFVALLSQRVMVSRRRESERQVLARQVNALKNYATLLAEHNQEVRRIHHDMRHYNRMLLQLIESGNTEEAVNMLKSQDSDLMASPTPVYCSSAIINAALAVYLQRARETGVRLTYKIGLPSREEADSSEADTETAVMLSNVLENAVNASQKQPVGEREITLSFRYVGEQYILSLENRFDAPLVTGPDGLPKTSVPGHGTGMVSLANFRDKHRAELIFEQSEGWVRLLMYWLDEPEPAPEEEPASRS